MIPVADILADSIEEITYPNETYKINFAKDINENKLLNIVSVNLLTESTEMDKISGYIDGLESVIQAIYLILNTERYKFIIYSWDYGVELVDLYGKPIPYVIAELPRRITEALFVDDRIVDVTDFEFEKIGNSLSVTFKVHSNQGDVSIGMEVNV